MTWLGWLLVIDLAWSALIKVNRVGETRTTTGAEAACQVAVTAAYLVGVFTIGVNA